MYTYRDKEDVSISKLEKISLCATQDYKVLLAELKDKNIDHGTVS